MRVMKTDRPAGMRLVPLLAALFLLLGIAAAHAGDLSSYNELAPAGADALPGEASISQTGDWNEGHIAMTPWAGINDNSAGLSQVGNTNYAAILQEGNLNIATQSQQGTLNEARISQQGVANTAIQQQVGSGNYASAVQTGNSNYLSQSQNGTGLRSDITQTGGMTLTVIQSN